MSEKSDLEELSERMSAQTIERMASLASNAYGVLCLTKMEMEDVHNALIFTFPGDWPPLLYRVKDALAMMKP